MSDTLPTIYSLDILIKERYINYYNIKDPVILYGFLLKINELNVLCDIKYTIYNLILNLDFESKNKLYYKLNNLFLDNKLIIRPNSIYIKYIFSTNRFVSFYRMIYLYYIKNLFINNEIEEEINDFEQMLILIGINNNISININKWYYTFAYNIMIDVINNLYIITKYLKIQYNNEILIAYNKDLYTKYTLLLNKIKKYNL